MQISSLQQGKIYEKICILHGFGRNGIDCFHGENGCSTIVVCAEKLLIRLVYSSSMDLPSMSDAVRWSVIMNILWGARRFGRGK